MLSLHSLAPGEDQLVTQAELIALASQKASCESYACPSVTVLPPALSDASSSGSQFLISSGALVEITAGLDATELGLKSVTWSSNPWRTQAHGEDGLPSTENYSVVSVSVTASGSEVSVSNLSSPITMTLPIPRNVWAQQDEEAHTGFADKDVSTVGIAEEQYHGVCEPKAPIAIHCNSTDEDYNITCETKESYNATCPRISFFAECLFWDGDTWSADGVSALQWDDDHVYCQSTHLSAYVGVVGRTASGLSLIFGTYEEVTSSDITKAVGFLCVLVGCYCFSALIMLRDLRKMRRARILRAKCIVRSEHFLNTLRTIRGRGNLDSCQGATRASRPGAEERQQRMHDEALRHLNRHRHLSLAASFEDFARALAEQHKLIAAFASNEPTFERAPIFLAELLTFIVGCAIIHVVNGDSILAEYREWAEAFDTGFVAVCSQFRASFNEAIRDTICLAMVVRSIERV